MKVDYIDCFYKEGTSRKGQNCSTTEPNMWLRVFHSGFSPHQSPASQASRGLEGLGLHSQCFTLGVNVFITAHSTQHRTQERETTDF